MNIQAENIKSRSRTPVTVHKSGSVSDLKSAIGEQIGEDAENIQIIFKAAVQAINRKLAEFIQLDGQVIQYSVVKRAAVPQAQSTETIVQNLQDAHVTPYSLTNEQFARLSQFVTFDKNFVVSVLRKSALLQAMVRGDQELEARLNNMESEADEFLRIISDGEKLKDFLRRRDDTYAQMLENEDERLMLERQASRYQKAREEVRQTPPELLSIATTLGSEVELGFRYQKQLDTLRDMGFDVREEVLRRLLEQHEGRLSGVLAALNGRKSK